MVRLLRVLVPVVAFCWVTPLAAQAPQTLLGRFEVPWLDWPANSAWRRQARMVRENRLTFLRSRDFRALNQPIPRFAPGAAAPSRAAMARPAAAITTAVTGTYFVPVIPIAYSNVAVPFPIADYQSVLFGTTPPNNQPYTVKTFYEELSKHRIQMFGRVMEPVRTDSTHQYYENNCNGIGVITSCPDNGQRFGLMLLSVLDSVSNRPGADTVWAQFDNDGPDGIPNSGDDDGLVDFVTFLQPTIDGACGTLGVWAHRFVISAWNGGSPYVTKTPRRDAQKNILHGPNGEILYIKVDNYTIQSEVGGPSACNGTQIMPIGTVAHETGHAFGLPDLYDTQRFTEGVGEWSLMGSGNYSRPPSPSSYDAWSLNELGWITVDSLTVSRTVTTGPRQLTDTIFIAPTVNPNEFLFVENRQPFQSDTAQFRVDNSATGSDCRMNCKKLPGLLLWHIDLAQIAAGRTANQVNIGSVQGVALEQADGLNNLRSTLGATKNRGDIGDSYPGSTNNTRYGFATLPASRTNAGVYSGFVIDQIQQLPNQNMAFRFLRRQPSLVASSVPGAVFQVNGTSTSRFEDVVAQGDALTLSVAEEQTIGDGRTRARFLSWSNGGQATQTITSGAVPDTLTASFAVEYRVKVLTSGGGQGSVAAQETGDVAGGVFLADGASITLTATPQAGTLFAGWRGDTTAFTPTLTLNHVKRPYDLTAYFLVSVPVAVADATADILGTATLTADQKTFLDSLGNRNGMYDLGDYLALLLRNGQSASPEVLRALAARSASKGAKAP